MRELRPACRWARGNVSLIRPYVLLRPQEGSRVDWGAVTSLLLTAVVKVSKAPARLASLHQRLRS